MKWKKNYYFYRRVYFFCGEMFFEVDNGWQQERNTLIQHIIKSFLAKLAEAENYANDSHPLQ